MSNSPEPGFNHLHLLYRLSQKFNSSLELDEVLNQVMDEVISAMQAERGFIMLMGPDDDLQFKVARGIDQATIDLPAFQVSRGIASQVATAGEPILTSDAQADSFLRLRASAVQLGLRSVLCVPLQVKGINKGAIYVDNRLHAGIFSQLDLELLNSIAATAAIAIENARLYGLAVEQGRMESELRMAFQVQSSLLPDTLPSREGWDFAAPWKPARVVSGDYYDFLPISGDRLAFWVADVTDKGMPAALFMALSRSLVRASVSRDLPPAEAIEAANSLIASESSLGLFVTLFFASLNLSTGDLDYVNAGHNPALFFSADDAALRELSLSGIPLGILDHSACEQQRIHLEPGDFILLYTDGVLDANGAEGEFFGMDRLRAQFLRDQGSSARETLQGIERALEEFTVGSSQYDDIT